MNHSIFKAFGLRNWIRRIAWRLYAWSENLNDIRFDKNGEAFFIKHIDSCSPFVFFDVGANIGEYSQFLLDKMPSAEAHLFEPLPRCISRLRDLFQDKNAVFINECAVSNKEFLGTLYFNEPTSPLASFSKRDEFYGVKGVEGTLTVKTITLERYIQEKNISHINLLKVDVEGHELEVLEGAGRFLSPDFVDYVQFEYGGCGIDCLAPLRSLYRFFEARGFEVCKIMPKGLWKRRYYPVMDNFQYANYMAVSPKVLLTRSS